MSKKSKIYQLKVADLIKVIETFLYHVNRKMFLDLVPHFPCDLVLSKLLQVAFYFPDNESRTKYVINIWK